MIKENVHKSKLLANKKETFSYMAKVSAKSYLSMQTWKI